MIYYANDKSVKNIKDDSCICLILWKSLTNGYKTGNSPIYPEAMLDRGGQIEGISSFHYPCLG